MKSGNQSSVPSFEPGTEPNGASKDGGRGRTCRINLSFPFSFLSVPILNLQLVNQAPNPTLVLYPSLLFSAFLLKSSCSAIPYLAFSFTRSPAFCFPLASLLTPAYPRSSSLLSLYLGSILIFTHLLSCYNSPLPRSILLLPSLPLDRRVESRRKSQRRLRAGCR